MWKEVDVLKGGDGKRLAVGVNLLGQGNGFVFFDIIDSQGDDIKLREE